jgi:hypothetical protein
MGAYNDWLSPFNIEGLRRSIAMLPPAQHATIDRSQALTLLGELQRLQEERKRVASELQGVLDRLQGTDRHPSQRPRPG